MRLFYFGVQKYNFLIQVSNTNFFVTFSPANLFHMKKTYLLLFSVFLVSCSQKKEKKQFPLISKAQWVIGEWKNNDKNGHFTEKWEVASDSTFMGESYILSQNDTVFFENMVLEQREDSLFYNVSLKKQNEVTSFYLTKADEKQLVFENPKHDYPTKITYTLVTKDSIIAEISGLLKGKITQEKFPMKKNK